jgi:glycosyltransferase involved in cell wall biosynthesis
LKAEALKFEPLVSIIVPIFNAESHLEQCVDSLLGQSYSNLEVILVDDGSTDASGELCNLFRHRDDRVRVIHSENNGVSSARNMGIRASRGDFLQFVDSDDFVAPTMTAVLVSGHLTAKADCTMTGYVEVDSLSGAERRYQWDGPGSFDRHSFLEAFPALRNGRMINYCWNKLFNAAIVVESGLEFSVGMDYGEDQIFVLNYLSQCETIIVLSDTPYVHILNENVDSLSRRFQPKMYDFVQLEMSTIHGLLREAPEAVLRSEERRHALSLVTEMVPYFALHIPPQRYRDFSRVASEMRRDEFYLGHFGGLEGGCWRDRVLLRLFRASRFESIYVLGLLSRLRRKR